jgi:hypothetical protein
VVPRTEGLVALQPDTRSGLVSLSLVLLVIAALFASASASRPIFDRSTPAAHTAR